MIACTKWRNKIAYGEVATRPTPSAPAAAHGDCACCVVLRFLRSALVRLPRPRTSPYMLAARSPWAAPRTLQSIGLSFGLAWQAWCFRRPRCRGGGWWSLAIMWRPETCSSPTPSVSLGSRSSTSSLCRSRLRLFASYVLWACRCRMCVERWVVSFCDLLDLSMLMLF